MTPSVIEADQRHRRFHAEIARRAVLVPQREELTRFIPNTPFGVPKIRPVKWFPKVSQKLLDLQDAPANSYWHCMWFADLITIRAPRPPGPPSIDAVQRIICRHFGITKIDINSDRRTHNVVIPRQIAMCLAKQLTGKSLPEIGRRFGNRDHTTVLHAVRKMEARYVSTPKFAAEFDALKLELRA